MFLYNDHKLLSIILLFLCCTRSIAFKSMAHMVASLNYAESKNSGILYPSFSNISSINSGLLHFHASVLLDDGSIQSLCHFVYRQSSFFCIYSQYISSNPRINSNDDNLYKILSLLRYSRYNSLKY